MIKGKALLVLTRLNEDDADPRYEVTAFIQSCSGDEDSRDCAIEEFTHLEYDIHPVPGQARRLTPGETIRLSVVFEINYSRDYWGEWDSWLEFHKVRVRRRQKERVSYRGKR